MQPVDSSLIDYMVPISGEQIWISGGGYDACIAQIGATLRSLRLGSRDLIVPFKADELRPNFRGAILAPWPNRVIDGTYEFAGAREQLPLTEPQRQHALHGLVAWLAFRVVAREASSVTLRTMIEPQEGYPHRVQLTVEYRLNDTGLTTTVTALNIGSSPAPFGVAGHPYLVAGDGRVDDWKLDLQAHAVFTTIGPRMLAGEVKNIEPGSDFDFTTNGAIGARKIDHAFTAVDRQLGYSTARLTDSAGAGVAMVWDETCAWVQVHTADLPDPLRSRIGLAIEPMTCPPDAFNSQVDLAVILPTEEFSASWRIEAIENVQGAE